MTVKLLAAGVAAAAVVAGGLTLTAGGAAPADPAVAPAVFGVPLPLDPAPVEPAPAPAQPTAGAPLPTTDEVAGLLTRLTDAGIGYKEKGNLVENGIEQGDGHVLDHELRKAYRDGELPFTFDVQNVTPTTPGNAVANVTISGPKLTPRPTPLTLVDQGGTWVLTQDSSKALLALLTGN